MISVISSTKLNFKSRTVKSKVLTDEVVSKTEKFSSSIKSKMHEIPSENLKAYANIKNYDSIKLSRQFYGYGIDVVSEALPVYRGPKNSNAGFSTESNGRGGGWICADLDTPLSTKDLHTCAAINLVNEAENKHILYHVLHMTSAKNIKNFIWEKFPKFNKVNIIPGDQYETTNTINDILEAVNDINPKCTKKFYHFNSDNPEVVASNGSMSYIKGRQKDKMTFNEIGQYYYSPTDNI